MTQRVVVSPYLAEPCLASTPPGECSVISLDLTGCKHLIGRCPRTTGSNLARHAFWRTLKTKASGCQRPLKQWCLVPVCKHGHGGGDDSNGDTRLARGLPFGRMFWFAPRTRCLARCEKRG